MTLLYRLPRIILSVWLVSFLSFCYAEPVADDISRVKRYFYQLRFQSVFDPALRPQSDRQLFELSCQQNRVQCDRVIEMIKSSDIEFYTKLMQ